MLFIWPAEMRYHGSSTFIGRLLDNVTHNAKVLGGSDIGIWVGLGVVCYSDLQLRICG